MTKTKTCWVSLHERYVHFSAKRNYEKCSWSEWGCLSSNECQTLFGWLPGKRPVEVRLEKVDRRKDGTMKANRKPRRKAK